jgi:hypothetical protein
MSNDICAPLASAIGNRTPVGWLVKLRPNDGFAEGIPVLRMTEFGRLLPDADALTAESLEPMDGLGLKFVLLKVGPTLHRSRF